MVPVVPVATSYQCLRTYILGLPWRHLPVSRQVRNTAYTVMVHPRHTNLRGRPGSPIAIREVSAVSVIGLIGSLMNRSDMFEDSTLKLPPWKGLNEACRTIYFPDMTDNIHQSFSTAFTNKTSKPTRFLPSSETYRKFRSQALQMIPKVIYLEASVAISRHAGILTIASTGTISVEITKFFLLQEQRGLYIDCACHL